MNERALTQITRFAIKFLREKNGKKKNLIAINFSGTYKSKKKNIFHNFVKLRVSNCIRLQFSSNMHFG